MPAHFASTKKHFVDAMWFQPRVHLFRKPEMVAGQRIQSVESGLAREPMISMREAVAVRIPGHDDIRLEAPDLKRQPASKLRCVLNEAIRVPQEDALLNAQHLARVKLF